MATPLNFVLPLSGDNLVDLSMNGYGWALDADRKITWSASLGFAGEGFDPGLIEYYQAAFDIFALYINVKFEYLGVFNDPNAAYQSGSNINIFWDSGSSFFPDSSFLAIAGFPETVTQSAYPGMPGDVIFNANSASATLPYTPGSEGWWTLIHELGHAMGLKHTHDDGGTGRPTMSDLDIADLDKDWVSMMSYNDTQNESTSSFDPLTPMFLDVIGLQYLYGANTNTFAGDDSALEIQSITDFRTIWDASGANDYVDASAYTEGVSINLPIVLGSALFGFAGPLAEADKDAPTSGYWLMGEIEHALGSSFNDELVGNHLNNILDGRAGTDVVQYEELARSNATITAVNGGFSVSAAAYGTDTLVNVERIGFASGDYVGLDIDGVGGKCYRVYQAAFGRTPDEGGLGYWIAQMDAGMDLIEVANRFLDSAEYQALYGSNPSNDEFLTAIYRNVLNRAPDNEGYAWWLNEINTNPEKTQGKVLADFSESPENQANVIGVIQNGFDYDLWAMNA